MNSAAEALVALSQPPPTPVKVKVKRHITERKVTATATSAATATATATATGSSSDVTCPSCQTAFKLSAEQKKKLRRQDFIDEVIASDENCFRYTGVPNVTLLHDLFKWVSPTAGKMKLWAGKYKYTPGRHGGRRRKILTLFEEYIMTLVRIRRGYDTAHLGYLFGICQSHVSRLFITWINLLYHCFLPLLRWPSKDLVKGNLPVTFRRYPNTRVIIDATEFHIEKPFRPHAQRSTWSNYKQANTLKLLVGIQPSGPITFLSKLYSGSISDQHITAKSGLLDLVEEGDDVMADRGFNIRHLLLRKRCTLNIPAFSHGRALSAKAVKRSRKIARVRIHVERAIKRIKTFKILSGIIPLRLRFSLNQIVTIVSVLCNMQKRLA